MSDDVTVPSSDVSELSDDVTVPSSDVSELSELATVPSSDVSELSELATDESIVSLESVPDFVSVSKETSELSVNVVPAFSLVSSNIVSIDSSKSGESTAVAISLEISCSCSERSTVSTTFSLSLSDVVVTSNISAMGLSKKLFRITSLSASCVKREKVSFIIS